MNDMIVINIKELKETLPQRGNISLGKASDGTPHLKFEVLFPSLFETGSKDEAADLERLMKKQIEIIKRENIRSFYIDQVGACWYANLHLNKGYKLT